MKAPQKRLQQTIASVTLATGVRVIKDYGRQKTVVQRKRKTTDFSNLSSVEVNIEIQSNIAVKSRYDDL